MKLALFTGCTIPARALNYEISARRLADALGIEMVDIKNASCCGMPVRNINRIASLTMSANTLAQADEMGMDLMTLCSACNATLAEAAHELNHDKELRKQINKNLVSAGGKPYNGDRKVWHFTRYLYQEIGSDKIASLVKHPLNGISVVAHAGCHYLKPTKTFECFDDPEVPSTLDQLIQTTGAKSVKIINRNECCSGGILGIKESTSLKVVGGKLKRIKDRGGVDAMVLHCPFCNIQYEGNQKKIEREVGEVFDLPVLYLPQLLGLALGIDEKDLGFSLNRIKPKVLLEKMGA